MAWTNVTPVAANLHLYQGATISLVQAGEAIAAGEAVYKKADGSKYWRADADTLAEADCKGIAVCAADAADTYFVLCKKGPIDMGAVLVLGETYYVSATVGDIGYGDVPAGDYVTIVGVATATNKLEVDIDATGIAHA